MYRTKADAFEAIEKGGGDGPFVGCGSARGESVHSKRRVEDLKDPMPR